MKKFLLFQIVFIFGVIVAFFAVEGEILQIFCVFILGAILLKGVFKKSRIEMKIIILIVVLGLLVGVFRTCVVLENVPRIEDFYGNFEVRGCISEDPDIRTDKVKYILDGLTVKEKEWTRMSGKLLINAQKYPSYEYGDCLHLSGKIEKAGVIDGFDYEKYLAIKGIYGVVNYAKILKVEESEKSEFFSAMYFLKGVFEDRLAFIFPEPDGSIMAGLITGSRRGIPADLMDKFNMAGISHIVAISGYNISVIIAFVAGILSFLGRKRRIILSILFVLVFVVFVGAGGSVVRAGIMGIIGLFGLFWGRQYDAAIGLFWAVFLMTMFNPRLIFYDVGFQLSFMATFGLIFVSPMIEKYFTSVPETFGIRASLLATMAAQVGALPIMIVNFGRLSIVSPICNIFVLPFIPFAMLFGFVAAILSFVSGILANVVGFPGYLCLEFIIFCAKFFGGLNFAAVKIEIFPWWIFMLYYFFLAKKVFHI